MSKVRVNIKTVRQLMADKQIEQKDLAKLIGVSQSTIKKYLVNDYNYLPIVAVLKIAEVFRIPIVEIIA